MNRELRDHISETYDGSAWEAETGILWENGCPWQLMKFEQDVDFDGAVWRCVIISRTAYDPYDIEAVDYSEDVFSRAWIL